VRSFFTAGHAALLVLIDRINEESARLIAVIETLLARASGTHA